MLKTFLIAKNGVADLKARIADLSRDDSGAAMIEYALLIGLVAIAGIAAFTALQGNLSAALGRIGGHLTSIQ